MVVFLPFPPIGLGTAPFLCFENPYVFYPASFPCGESVPFLLPSFITLMPPFYSNDPFPPFPSFLLFFVASLEMGIFFSSRFASCRRCMVLLLLVLFFFLMQKKTPNPPKRCGPPPILPFLLQRGINLFSSPFRKGPPPLLSCIVAPQPEFFGV